MDGRIGFGEQESPGLGQGGPRREGAFPLSPSGSPQSWAWGSKGRQVGAQGLDPPARLFLPVSPWDGGGTSLRLSGAIWNLTSGSTGSVLGTEAVPGPRDRMGCAEPVEEGLGPSRTFPQQFLASLKTGSWLSREPPARFPEPPRDACWGGGVGGDGAVHACVCLQEAQR